MYSRGSRAIGTGRVTAIPLAVGVLPACPGFKANNGNRSAHRGGPYIKLVPRRTQRTRGTQGNTNSAINDRKSATMPPTRRSLSRNLSYYSSGSFAVLADSPIDEAGIRRHQH